MAGAVGNAAAGVTVVLSVGGVAGSAGGAAGVGIVGAEPGARPRATATMGASRGGAAGWRLIVPDTGLAAG